MCPSTTTWRSSRPDCPSQGHNTLDISTYLHIYISPYLHIYTSGWCREAAVTWCAAVSPSDLRTGSASTKSSGQLIFRFYDPDWHIFSYSGITGSFLEDTRSTFALQSWRGRSHLRRCGDCRLTGDWVSFITFTHQPTIILRSHWCTCALYVLALLACSQ